MQLPSHAERALLLNPDVSTRADLLTIICCRRGKIFTRYGVTAEVAFGEVNLRVNVNDIGFCGNLSKRKGTKYNLFLTIQPLGKTAVGSDSPTIHPRE